MTQSRRGLIAEKQCTQCHQTKPVTEFDYDKNNRCYSSRCKDCRRAAQAVTEPRRQAVRAFYRQVAAAGGVWKLVELAAKQREE